LNALPPAQASDIPWLLDWMEAANATNKLSDEMRWNVVTSGPNWRVETDYRSVRWDDVIEALSRQSSWPAAAARYPSLF
jgi:hypothetical protein